jgi:beta-N-acetylhexosaminidase
MNVRRYLCTCLILAGMLFGPQLASAGGSSAELYSAPVPQEDIEARIEAILDQLSVAERVGQLIIVNFVGQTATPADAISQLILEYKVGGVVLLEGNNNIDNSAEDTPGQVANLANQLQTRAFEATHHATSEDDFFIPLFIAVDHEGDGFPNTHLRNGFTPVPSTMALGATWSPTDVEAVGAIIGQELAAVGVNMLLGPVVDVLERPRPEGSGDINIRAFGGSPFWVGQMGRAYIRGVHRGGAGRVLTVAKHFPGHGASDRLPDDEVATVTKTLGELQKSDLVPFFAVTRPDPADPLGVTDAMMPSHIRYAGFQGDVNQLTFPISLDREGMEAFMALSPLSTWREEGLIVCDSLGVDAVKGFYDPTRQSFPAKQIARDALMAGNDVLPLLKFAPADSPGWFTGQLPTIQETILFFQEEYRADESFRRRVDDAVRHILRAKLHLYPELALEDVLVTDSGDTGQRDDLVTEVARQALTLLYPGPEDLSRRLPSLPRPDEQILIVGCFEECLTAVRIRGETVRNALLDLYGPAGRNLVDPERVHLLDFMPLYRLMTGRPFEVESGDEEDAQAIIERIRAADWILFILVNYIPDTQPQTSTARLFLRDPAVTVNGVTTRFDLREKKLVALALHAPYYLDATEIGKLNAYYAVYSKVGPSLKVALRALFQDITPASAPPVSVEGIGYELATALLPDPDQSLKLTLASVAPQESAERAWHVGDEVHVRASPILDHNGNPVPDGTRVRFQGDYADLRISLSPRVVTDTVSGVAGAIFRPLEAGRLEISASAEGLEADPVSLLVAPLVTPTEAPPPVTASATPTVPPATVAVAQATETAPPPTATSLPPTATATSPPLASATPAPPAGGQASPLVPLLIGLAALLALGGLALLWYRSRPAAPAPATGRAAGDLESTATVSADLSDLSPALTGRTLGSCKVGQKLGEGGMGQVYQGYHPMLDRSVAIKILPPVLVESEEMQARFLQEARIAAALRHPNIVQVYDFGESEGLIYMTMEYVDGTSLKERLAQLRAEGEVMPITQAAEIARQIADALAYAHAQGAIHRDLKPANILLTPQGQAILVDFGLAVLHGGPRYTEPGKVWGSPSYIAPEQLGDVPRTDARSDVYSLGVILYEMVTGRPPFKGDSVMEILWQQANAPPRPPHELAPDVSPELEAIILKTLAKRPAERFATAQELADALKALNE